MKRGGYLRRVTPLRRVSKRREALAAARVECRQTVLSRSGGRCEACPRLHDGPGRAASDVHERLPRSGGGSIIDPDNCLAVCRTCHTHIHDHPDEAYLLGLLVHSWDNR